MKEFYEPMATYFELDRQYPDHARRVLDEMAEYGRYKPVIYNDWMADFAALE